MEILLWVVGIHLLEIILFLGYVLIKKNRKMEDILISQQETIDSIKILIGKMDDNFKEIDLSNGVKPNVRHDPILHRNGRSLQGQART